MRIQTIEPRAVQAMRDRGETVDIFDVRTPAEFEAVHVTLGQGDAAQVVVTGGLEAGQVVALNPPDLKQDFSHKAKKPESEKPK